VFARAASTFAVVVGAVVTLWGKLKTRPVADSVVTAVVAPLKETASFRLNESIASIRPFRRLGCDLRSGTRSPCQDPDNDGTAEERLHGARGTVRVPAVQAGISG